MQGALQAWMSNLSQERGAPGGWGGMDSLDARGWAWCREQCRKGRKGTKVGWAQVKELALFL